MDFIGAYFYLSVFCYIYKMHNIFDSYIIQLDLCNDDEGALWSNSYFYFKSPRVSSIIGS